MKKANKILSIILAILMVISIIPITSCAEGLITSGTCGDNVTWNIDMETWTLTISGTGEMSDYKSNNRPWEEFAKNVKTVVIADGVTTIGKNAFKKLTKLIHVEIGNDVTTIGEFAFNGCYTIDTVIIGSDVTQICDSAFSACNSLNYIYYMGTETEYNKVDWYEINEEEYDAIWFRVRYIFIEDIETDSGKCGKNLTWTYDVPACTLTISGTGDMDDYNYDKMPPWYQWRFFIKNIVMEEGITKIGELAFNGCEKLETATIPEGVKIINNGAFNVCYSLKEITIPESVTTINYGAFSSCTDLASVTMGKAVASIGEYAFAGCDNLTDVYYTGTEQAWNEINIFDYNEPLVMAKIHYNYCKHKYESVVTAPTCTEQGYTTYTCECGDSYISDFIDALGHNYQGEITTPATHTTTGIMTYTCTCGDSYTEVIAKIEKHNYESVITAPTCTEQGYTTYTCECGDAYDADYVDATGHTPANSVEENYVAPTCTENGSKDVVVYCSVCEEEISRESVVIEEIGHNYTTVVTPPTCTEQGYTTYTCECGDTYVDNYGNALGHTEETIPAIAPTCTETGLTEGSKCSVCGVTLTEQKELPANGHTPATAVEENYLAPTCTENGSKDVVVYCSVCDEEISRTTETIDATGHADNDGNGYCDADNELLDPSVECDHICHKGGISGFIWKIINFFNKLFGLNKVCECGVAHY